MDVDSNEIDSVYRWIEGPTQRGNLGDLGGVKAVHRIGPSATSHLEDNTNAMVETNDIDLARYLIPGNPDVPGDDLDAVSKEEGNGQLFA